MDYQGFALAMSKPWACKINKTVPRLLGFDCKGLDLLICSFLNVQHATVSGQISLNNTIQWRVSRPAIHPISVQPMPTKGRTGAADLTKKNNANFSRKEARADKGCSRPQAPDQQINPTAKHTSSRSRKEKQTNDIVWVCLSNTEILKLARAPRTESEATAGPYLFGDILLIGALLLAGIKADLAWFGCRSWGVRSMLKNVEDTVWSCMEALGSLWQACWRMCSFGRCPCSIWTTKSQKIAAGVWCMLAMHTLTPICHTSRRCHHGLDISRFFQDPSSQPQGMNVHMLDPGKKNSSWFTCGCHSLCSCGMGQNQSYNHNREMNIHFLKRVLVKQELFWYWKSGSHGSPFVSCGSSASPSGLRQSYACAAMQTLPVLSFMANLECPTANVILLYKFPLVVLCWIKFDSWTIDQGWPRCFAQNLSPQELIHTTTGKYWEDSQCCTCDPDDLLCLARPVHPRCTANGPRHTWIHALGLVL